MKRRKKLWMTLAVLVIAGITALTIYLVNKGAPAVDASEYVEVTAELEAGSELQVLQGGTKPVPGMQLVAKNEQLELYYHPETTEIAVVDLSSGKVWRSNPEGRDEDGRAAQFAKDSMASQLQITFRDEKGKLGTFINYADSISRGQFKTESIDNGIRITYTLGDMSVGIEVLPKLISKQRMQEKILSKLDEQTARFFETKYYPLKSDPNVLERIDAAASRPLTLTRMLDVLETVGYTDEDLAYDNEENGIAVEGMEERPNFTIPLEYRLDGDSLIATVPISQIEESTGYRLRSIRLLEYFGAAGDDEQGYMLVPDGMGSLIYLNNGKTNTEIYAQRVYGDDQNDNSSRRAQIARPATLPVFGLKSGNHAWFAQIIEGDAVASINADISGRGNSYNNVFSSFAVRGEDTLEIYKGTQWEEYELLTDQLIANDISVRYSFLSGDDANYSGMARQYREHLVSTGVLQAITEEKDLPFYLSVLGTVNKRKTILGVPYKGMIAMTTFDEASAMVDRLNADGVHNIQMRYVGWFNKGINHEIAAKVKVDRALGGKSDLKALHEKLEGSGGRLYPDVAFQHVFYDNRHYAPASDAARYVTREQVIRTPYNRAFNSMDRNLDSYSLLSPSKLPYYVDSFIGDYSKLGIDAVSLRDLGSLLHADYRVKRMVFRENAKNIVKESLAELDQSLSRVMIVGSNAYALQAADQIVNMPTTISKFGITDEAVPFLQLVLHGYIDYAGSPINLDDEQDLVLHMLRSAELGASPHFMWSEQSSSLLKYTPYDHLFSTEYTVWYDQAVDMYHKLNEVLGKLTHVPMKEHILHASGVAEVRYENGTSVYVNYTDQPVTVNGVTIDAKNFAAGGDNK